MKLTTEELAEMEAAVVACPPDWEETETGFDIRTTPDERGMSITVVHGEVSLDDLRDAIQEGDSLYTILSPAVRRLIANSRQWIPKLLAHIAEVEKENVSLADRIEAMKGELINGQPAECEAYAKRIQDGESPLLVVREAVSEYKGFYNLSCEFREEDQRTLRQAQANLAAAQREIDRIASNERIESDGLHSIELENAALRGQLAEVREASDSRDRYQAIASECLRQLWQNLDAEGRSNGRSQSATWLETAMLLIPYDHRYSNLADKEPSSFEELRMDARFHAHCDSAAKQIADRESLTTTSAKGNV